MLMLKCKMCGGDLNIQPGAKIAECMYCGSMQTIPNIDDERRANLYARAGQFRLNGDFDKAASIYDEILRDDNTDAEAHWSIVLCKYGIEYVQDPKTRRRIPTINRMQYMSIFDDADYLETLKHADSQQREVYEYEAKTIDNIQNGILEISRNEKPFDIFISYKETDGLGRRTQDSVYAYDIYEKLSQEGYRVFFSRITLESIVGTAYEPYIFAALNSAKVMIVVGTSAENMNAVWVRNEWSRFLLLMQQDKSKSLIPVYKDMNPYDLPAEFSYLQAQDMNRLGFMQDIVHGINKIIKKEVGNNQYIASQEASIGSGVANVTALLKRVSNFIEDNEWALAEQYCERILDTDPDNVQAYLFKLLIDKRVVTVEDLKNCSDSFEGNTNYQRLTKIADEKLKQDLHGYLDYIKEKNDRARIAKENAEKIRLKELEISRKKRNKILLWIASIIVIVTMFTSGIILTTQVIIPQVKYKNAVSLMEEGMYQNAIDIFKELDDYEDSKTLLVEAYYLDAVQLKESEKYDDSIEVFERIIDYKDSKKLIIDMRMEQADSLFENGEYSKAKEMYTKLEQDATAESKSHIDKNLSYISIIELYEKKDYEGCLREFEENESSVADLHDIYVDVNYKMCKKALESNNYDSALNYIEEYCDGNIITEDSITEPLYNAACDYMKKGFLNKAYRGFNCIDGSYKECSSMMKLCEEYKMYCGKWTCYENGVTFKIYVQINDGKIKTLVNYENGTTTVPMECKLEEQGISYNGNVESGSKGSGLYTKYNVKFDAEMKDNITMAFKNISKGRSGRSIPTAKGFLKRIEDY